MKYFILIVVIVLCQINISVAQENNLQSTKEFVVIDEDFKNGAISVEEALLQKFYFVFDKEKLNHRYLGKIASPLKCATGLMDEYYKNKNTLSLNAVNQIEDYLQRPFRKTAENFTYISPSGHFELTYATTGTDAVPAADNNGNSVPDYVEWIADYFDYSWAFEIDSLGYLPPPIGTERYQVGFESMEYYGYTDYVAHPSGKMTQIVMHNTFNGFPNNTDPEGDQKGAAKVTAAHEFKHAIQLVYSDWNEPGWFIEMDATWMEDIAYDYVNDYYNYLSSSHIVEPARSFANGSGYEDCLWLHYISEKYGVLSNRLIWERRLANSGENIFNTFNNILSTNYSSSFENGIREYFTWNYSTGNRATGLFDSYGEAAKYPSPTLCFNKNVLPDSSSGCGIGADAANFLYYGSNNQNKFINFVFNSAQGGPFGIEILIAYKNGTSERISTDVIINSKTINYIIQKKLSDINYFVLIPVVVSASGNARSFTCKVSAFSTAELSLARLKDVETPIERIVKAKAVTLYNIALKDSLKLYYSVNNSPYISIKMIPAVDEDEFSAVIPSVVSGSNVKYYLSIYDTLGNYTYYPEAGSNSPFEYYIGPDTKAPVITHLQKKAINQLNFPLSFYAEVEDNIGVDSVYLEYRINKGAIIHKKFSNVKNNLYKSTIEKENNNPDSGDNFEYKITAVDASSNHNRKSLPDNNFISVIISKGFEYTSVSEKTINENLLGTKDTIEIDDDIIISDFNFAFKAAHSRISDLILKIIPPFGKTSTLFSRIGLGTNFGESKNPDIILDQDAYFGVQDLESDSNNSFSGEFRPDTTNFDNFNGYSAKGKWILITADVVLGEKGTLEKWKLIIGSDKKATGTEDNLSTPSFYSLDQNYPNPFNPVTRISYSVPVESYVELKVFDILGRELAILVSGAKKSGNYEVDFDGSKLSSGIYFYRLETKDFTSVKKMIMVK